MAIPMFGSDDNEAWLESGANFTNEIIDAIQPIVQKWVAQGYSVRHIQLALFDSAASAGLDASLNKKYP